MKNFTLLLAAASTLALSHGAFARTAGEVSSTDSSVRIYDYQRDEVYELTGSFGITTQIWIGADERITSIQSGDAEAWDISVPESRDYVAVKPIVEPPRDTNLVIYTDKRAYTVALSALPEGSSRADAVFTARFRYNNAVDSIDALTATIRRLEDTEAALNTERQQRAQITEQYTTLQQGYQTAERELEARRIEEARNAELAQLQERLTYEQRTRSDLSAEALTLRNQIDAIRASKEQQVFDLLEARLSGAEVAQQAAEQRAAELQAALAAIKAEELQRDEDRLARELAEARQNRTALAEAEARIEALEEQGRAAQRAARSTVIFDAFSDASDNSSSLGPISTVETEVASFRERRFASRSDDQVFLNDAASRGIQTVEAVQIPNLDSMVLQGQLMSGTLETAINSDLSGLVRAVLSQPVYSADGSRVLADRGSRLVGEYDNAVRFGASRVLIAWNRLITTDGISVELGSPGTDGLGRAGLGGFSDTHFADRFGAAALISILGGGTAFLVSEATDEFTSETAGELADDSQGAFTQVLSPYLDIPTTVHVDQGTPLNVFVARDLDFSKVR